MVHSTGDDGNISTPVLWMPAHTARWQIGAGVRSDGAALSDKDREGNDLADRFAKVAAAGRRVREATRSAILESASDVMDMAKCIAAVTVRANHYQLADGAHIRDSQADNAAKSKRRGLKRHRRDCGDVGVPVTERLLKLPRLAALREWILAKGPQPPIG